MPIIKLIRAVLHTIERGPNCRIEDIKERFRAASI